MGSAPMLGPAIEGRHLVSRKLRRTLGWDSIARDAVIGLQAIGTERALDQLAVQFGGPGAWPLVLLALVRIGAPEETVRGVLAECWYRGHRALVDTVRDPAELAALFRAAGMTAPAELGDPVIVWRGGAGLTAAELSAGLSWSTRRDIACHYAVLHAERSGGDPLVVRRVVRRSDLAAWLDEEDGAEAVIAVPGIGEVDGTADDWREARTREADRQLASVRETVRLYAAAAAAGDPPPGPAWRLRHCEAVLASAAAKVRARPLVPATAAPGQDTAASAPLPSLVTPGLVARILAGYRLTRAGTHGPAHWLRVAANAAELARRTPGADAPLAELFALIHDCRRRTEGGDDLEHGRRAADCAEWLAAQGHLALDPTRVRILAEACRHHEAGKVTRHPTIAACRDADRLELARLGMRPRPDLLSTAAAQDAAMQAAAWARGQAQEIPADFARAWGLEPEALR